MMMGMLEMTKAQWKRFTTRQQLRYHLGNVTRTTAWLDYAVAEDAQSLSSGTAVASCEEI
jgi:hypothetical protein